MKNTSVCLSSLFFVLNCVAAVAQASPPCLDRGQPLPVMDEEVVGWKQSLPNQTIERAHVAGPIVRVYPDHSGHHHFAIQIGPRQSDSLEIIFNESFSNLPRLEPGMMIEACGDFIQSTAPAGPYPASPDGAILHWVHRNPKGLGHESGFVGINGIIFQ